MKTYRLFAIIPVLAVSLAAPSQARFHEIFKDNAILDKIPGKDMIPGDGGKIEAEEMIEIGKKALGAINGFAETGYKNPPKEENQTAEQKALYGYSDDRAKKNVFGKRMAVGGGILGGLVGCQFANDCKKGAAIGALAGAAIGGGSGYLLGKRQDDYADEYDYLDAKVEGAELELAEARSARKASEKIVDTRKKNLAKLRKEYQTDKSKQEALAKEIGEATYDAEQIAVAKNAVDANIKNLEEDLAAFPPETPQSKKLAQQKAELVSERDKLNKQLAELTDALESDQFV